MIKQSPRLGWLIAMAAFALSCFAIVLFLWISFGGSVPLSAKGYRFQVDFKEATLLTDNADVRISGVSVGRVISSEREGRIARAEIEMQPRYAPIPRNTRATLRQKTALGETYVELTPGSPKGPKLADGGRLPRGSAVSTPQFDEVLGSLLDPSARAAGRHLVAGLAEAVRGRGRDINDSLANTGPLATQADGVLGVLDRERVGMRQIVRDGGFVLGTVGRRQGELSGLLRSTQEVLGTTARRNRSLEQTVRILPTTLRELRPTFAAIQGFSNDARPVLRALRPAGRALGPALVDTAAVAPDLRALFGDVNATIAVGRTALPATTRVVDSARPVFGGLATALRDLRPAVDYLGLYRQELATLTANIAASTQGSATAADGRRVHYMRALVPIGPEAVVASQSRSPSNRHNPYGAPRWLDKLASGLDSIDCRNAGPSNTPAPPCRTQRPLRFRGRATAFPQLRRDP